MLYLTNKEIIKVIEDYKKDDKLKYSILLDGEWGTGKTYFIKNKIIKEENKDIYISLYGVKNIEDINKKVYYNILNNYIINENQKYSKLIGLIKKMFDFVNTLFKKPVKLIGEIFNVDLSILKNLDIDGIMMLFNNTDEYMLIFDDLERCDIPVNEVLGYINDYVEHKNTKCIIVANEKEISKLNYDNNYELKLLSCMKDNIDYKDTKKVGVEKSILNENKEYNIDIKILQERIEKLYNNNNRYKIIKEKVIGKTITYFPELHEIYDELIREYESNKNYYNYLIQNKEVFIDLIEYNDCINIRTIKFILINFEKLYDEVNKIENNNKSILIDLIFKNIIFSSIGLKKGINIQSLLKGTMFSNSVTLSNDAHQKNKDLFTAFDFVNDYIITSNLDLEKIKKTINYYFEINFELLDKEDPYNKLKCYWELEDNEIELYLDLILDKMKNFEYSFKLFPDILLILSSIEKLNFKIDKIYEIINEMKKYIKSKNINYIDFHTFAQNEDVIKIYNKHTKILNGILNNQKIYNTNDNINKIIQADDWGIKLYDFVEENNGIFLNEKSFLKNFDINLITKKILESNTKNIYHFKYLITRVYNFQNLFEYFSDDIVSFNYLISNLKTMEKSNFGVMKKDSIENLIKILDEKLKILVEK